MLITLVLNNDCNRTKKTNKKFDSRSIYIKKRRIIMNKDLNIFIAVHKKCSLPTEKGYIPLQVGAEGKDSLGFEKDSTGDNISLKNPNYCELTGLYWMWKNTKSKFIGLVHYRRYFFKKGTHHLINNVLSKKDAIDLLKEYDVLIPKKTRIIGNTVRGQFEKYHNIKDYDICRTVIEEKYPEYIDSFDKVSNRKYFYAFNMCIMGKKNFDEYCKWLFNILFEVEKGVDISNYSQYEKRLFGFLSERLFNVWLEEKKFKIKRIICI